MALLVAIVVIFAFAIGVAESTRIIKQLHIVAAELHVRIAALEAAVKAKL